MFCSLAAMPVKLLVKVQAITHDVIVGVPIDVAERALAFVSGNG